MKKLFKILAGIVTFIVVLIILVFYFTSGLVDVTNAFFKEASKGNLEQAKTYLSQGFKVDTSDSELLNFLNITGLNHFQESSWNSRHISGSAAHIEGHVLTKSNRTIPLKVHFIKEQGDWKIHHIEKASSGLTKNQVLPEIPDLKQATELVNQTTHDFGKAIEAKDFSSFHSKLAKEFREQVPLDQFTEIFSVLSNETSLDFIAFSKLKPFFRDKPALSEDAVLKLTGHYEADTVNLYFRYKYIYRDNNWQVLGIKYDRS